MKQFFRIPILLSALMLVGCSTPEIQQSVSAESMPQPKRKSRSADSVMPEPAASPFLQKKLNANSASHFQSPEGRKMTFTADISLQVTDAKKAAEDTRKLIMAEGGYVKSMNNTTLVLAVPVKKGDQFLEKISGMGEVTNLNIQGNDVTDQVTDLEIRLENLEKSRKRLLLLMERTADVKDLTQVERELNRVTTELERLQASKKNLSNQITYITMTIRFRTVYPVQQEERSARLPLEWINQLGNNLQTPVQAVPDAEQDLPFTVTLPKKFMFAGGNEAVSGNSCVISLLEISNMPVHIRWYGKKYAETAFYKDLVMESLKTRFNGEVTCTEGKIGGLDALQFQGETKIGNISYLYRLVLAVDGDRVKIIEARGTKEKLLKDLSPENWQKFLNSVDF